MREPQPTPIPATIWIELLPYQRELLLAVLRYAKLKAAPPGQFVADIDHTCRAFVREQIDEVVAILIGKPKGE